MIENQMKSKSHNSSNQQSQSPETIENQMNIKFKNRKIINL